MAAAQQPVSLRQDAEVIGLVGVAQVLRTRARISRNS